jgi:hypothetical protein
MTDMRSPVFHCPFCGRVRKHGTWITITVDELVKLYRATTIVVIGLTCPDCKELKHG